MAKSMYSKCMDWFPRMQVCMMEHLFTSNLVIQGYYEIGNLSDPCAVAVKKATLGTTASFVSGSIPHYFYVCNLDTGIVTS